MNSTSPAPRPTQPERQRRTKVYEFINKKTGSTWCRFFCGQLISKDIYNSLVSNGSNPMACQFSITVTPLALLETGKWHTCQPSSGSSWGAEVITMSPAGLPLEKPFFR